MAAPRQLIAAILALGLGALPMAPAFAATVPAKSPAPAAASGPVTPARPRGPWIVGPINAQASSGVGFCSMKNSYDDGRAVIFARDAEGSNSIAVSFADKFMQSGAQYPVTLAAEGLKRDMIALAATPKVMIIQMGLDRDFYTILRKKETLEIGFRDKRFAFQLGGTSDALDALTKCAMDVAAGKNFAPRSIALGSAPQEPLVIAPATPDATAADLNHDFSIGETAATKTLRDELDRLRLENRKLMAENQAMTAKLIGQPNEVAATADDIVGAELEAQEKDLRTRNARLARDNARLKLREQQALAESAVESPAGDTSADSATAEDNSKVIGSQILSSPDPATAIEDDAAAKAAAAVADAAGPAGSMVKTTKQSARKITASAPVAPPAAATETPAAPPAPETFATLDGLDDALRPQDAPAAPVAPEKTAAAVARAPDQAAETPGFVSASMAPVAPAKNTPAALASPAPVAVAPVKASASAPSAAVAAAPMTAVASAPIISPSTSSRPAVAASKQAPAPQQAAIDPGTVARLAATAPAAGNAAAPLHKTGDFLQDMLTAAGIQPQRGGAGYSWQSGGVFGSAEERRLPPGRGLGELAANYAEQSKARCRGDFAHKEAAPATKDGVTTVESEVACIDGKHDAAAAILFVQQDDRVAIVAQESMADKIEGALSQRDAIKSAISK